MQASGISKNCEKDFLTEKETNVAWSMDSVSGC